MVGCTSEKLISVFPGSAAFHVLAQCLVCLVVSGGEVASMRTCACV